MLPTPGDIYVVHNNRLDAYVAVQVTQVGSPDNARLVAVMTLDWTGQHMPDAAELDAMRPAHFDFMFWNAHRQHLWINPPVPRRFQHVGRREPLVQENVKTYGGQWPDGAMHYLQRRWNGIDADIRSRFKAAAHGGQIDNTVVLDMDQFPVTRATRRLGTQALLQAVAQAQSQSQAQPHPLSIFDALPVLTAIEATAPIPGLLPWLRTRPIINELVLSGQNLPVIDLRGTNLMRASVDVTGVRELYLNDGLSILTLTGTASPDLVIHAEDGGRWLTLYLQAAAPVWSGLPALRALHLHGVKTLEAGDIARAFPQLDDLRVSGAPGVVNGLERLADLGALESLTLTDVFPPDGTQLPGPAAWPQLESLWLASVPAALAASVKAAYKAEVKRGLSLSVRQPRKPDWLAANLDNPFREWDGSEHITAAQAKKAATLYRKAHADALKQAAELATQPAPLADALRAIVLAYTKGFNTLDRRTGFIETVERDQIYVALMSILDAAEAKRREVAGDSAAALDLDTIAQAMDDVREF